VQKIEETAALRDNVIDLLRLKMPQLLDVSWFPVPPTYSFILLNVHFLELDQVKESRADLRKNGGVENKNASDQKSASTAGYGDGCDSGRIFLPPTFAQTSSIALLETCNGVPPRMEYG